MVLGIDLGTSNTVAATLSRDNIPVLIPDYLNRDYQFTPSSVLINGKKAYAGIFAENLYDFYPNKEIYKFFKRKFGTQLPVFIDEEKKPWFSETLAALILKKVHNDALYFMGNPYENLVITVPAHYNDAQRKSIIEAARLANMDLGAILDEPIAAALYYGQQNETINEEIIMVYDFGGGTFDLTVITKTNNKIHVIAKDGISNLGGKEFDEIVSNIIINDYEALTKLKFPQDSLSQNRLKKISEEIKIKLNTRNQDSFDQWMMFYKSIFKSNFDKKEYAIKANDLIQKTEEGVNRCLRSLGMRLDDIHKIIFIGGTSNSHLVFDYWQKKINPNKQAILYHQPLASVAKGAAIYANSLRGKSNSLQSDIELQTVSTYNLGLKTESGEIDLFIARNTPLPCVNKKVFKFNKTGLSSLELCQYWDKNTDLQEMGNIQIKNPNPNSENQMFEIALENRINGTIAVKVKNAQNGKEIPFEFLKKKQQFEYDFDYQSKIISDLTLNTIF